MNRVSIIITFIQGHHQHRKHHLWHIYVIISITIIFSVIIINFNNDGSMLKLSYSQYISEVNGMLCKYHLLKNKCIHVHAFMRVCD